MFRKVTLIAVVLLVVSGFVRAQSGYCGTLSPREEVMQRTDLSDAEKAELLQQIELYEAEISKRASEGSGLKEDEVLVIPVVFHVFHNYGKENISDAQIYDQLRIMNEEFNKRNAKLSQVVPEFQPIIADVKLDFKLATLDPNGNCTNGINRYYHPNPYFESKAPIQALKAQYIWPRNKYLNCFVVGSIETTSTGTTLGYAQFPGGNASTDGLVMVHYGIGSIGTGNSQNQSVSTHEIGHWLGLFHTWGNGTAGEGCTGDDMVADTPPTKGSPSVCDLGENSCGQLANVQNFMDYSFCYAMFTKGQGDRMRATLASTTSGRNNLWAATNLTATGADYTTEPTTLCKADFLPENNKPICAGETMTYIDHSFYNVTSWNWEFEGGSPATSSDPNPTVAYPAPGTYKVTLTVSNGVDTETTTKNAVVTVMDADMLGAQYQQTFETLSLQNDPDFTVTNPDNDKTWVIKDGGAYEGNRSIYINNRLITGEDKVDDLISGTFDFSNMGQPKLKFNYAFAGKSTTSTDELQIMLSTDCGVTWKSWRVMKGTLLKTAPDAPTTDFVPSGTAQWKEFNTALPTNYKVPGVRFRFSFINGGGNNLYLDNINVYDGSTSVTEDLAAGYALNVYPNPVDDVAQISFSLGNAAKTTVELFDIVGKKIQTLQAGQSAAGEHSLSLNSSGLPSGVYFVKLTIDRNTFTRKVIIK